MFDRYIITPIIAIGLAFLVWVYLRSRDQDMETAPVALEIIVDPQQAGRYVFEALPKDQVQVKFFGLPSRLRFVKDMLSALLALVAAVGAAFSFYKYTTSGDNKVFLVIAIVCVLATVALGGLFLSGRVNKNDDIHITE